MAYMVMAYEVMAYTVMAYIVMAIGRKVRRGGLQVPPLPLPGMLQMLADAASGNPAGRLIRPHDSTHEAPNSRVAQLPKPSSPKR